MLHLREFGHADADHPYAALSLLGMAIFAVGTFLGGLVSAYAGMRISRWLLTAGTIAILGCLVAYDSAEVFQNAISIWLTSSVAGFFGCWIGTRLAGVILV